MNRAVLTLITLLISLASFGQVGPITGSTTVCVGGTTVLNNDTVGGVWSSSNPAIASVGSLSGVVTGLTSGIVTITYSTGAIATAPVTVNAVPAPITGPSAVCLGNSATFSDPTPGGVWSSSNPSILSINPSTGLTSAVGTGAVTILYSYPSTGCAAVRPVSVNLSPTGIGGVPTVCAGGNTTLTNLVTGGMWSSSTTVVATVGSSSGTVTGISPGTAVITYTLGSGCTVNTTITVNPVPAAISGTPAACNGATTTLADATPGGNFYSNNTSIAAVGATTGIVTGVSAGVAVISYTLSTSCTAIRIVTINALPSIYSLTGGGAYCVGGAGAPMGLSGSQAGVSYQLYSGATPIGGSVAGTGSPVTFGLITGVGASYTAVATGTFTGCASAMSGVGSISTNPLPAVYTISFPSGTSVCAGGTGFHILLSGSTPGINYQVFLAGSPTGPVVPGTGSPLDFGAFVTGGAYTVGAHNPITTCTNQMAGGATVTMNPLPAVYNVSGGGSYCSGGTGSSILLSGSNVGVSYQLLRGGTPTGTAIPGTGGILDMGLQTIAGTYTVIATNSSTTCTQTMSGSATVGVNPLPATFALTGGGSYCSGGAGLNVSLSGSETGVSYQLFNGSTMTGSALMGTGTGLSFGNQSAPGTYAVIATNTTTGCSNNMTSSVTITVIPSPNAYAVTGGGPYCAGSAGVGIGLGGSQTGVNYQLYKDGMILPGSLFPGTGSFLSFGLFASTGTYTVVATSTTTGCSINMSGSVIVSINPAPTTHLVTGGGAFCFGGTGVPAGLASSSTGTSYQLMLGTTPMGAAIMGTGSALDFGFQTTGGNYTVLATNMTTGCTANMGGTATVIVNPLPNAYAVTGGGSYCSGGSGVHIGLSSSNAGINYQLYNGVSTSGIAIGGTGTSLDFGLRTGVGVYTVVAVNPSTTCTSSMSGSATVSITSLTTPTIAMSVTPNDTVCAGTTVTFNQTSTGGGSSPTYMWIKNGVAVSAATSYSYIAVDGDIIAVNMTSSAPCPSPTIVSDMMTMHVLPAPAITGSALACVGSTTVLSGPAGSTWVSGTPSVAVVSTIGTTTGVVSGMSTGTSVITCSLGGCTSTMTVTVNSVPTVSITSTPTSCGGSFSLTASGAATYSWATGPGIACPTCSTNVVRPTNTTTYFVTGTALNGCTDTATISVNGNRISGYISYSGVSTDIFKVWLIQFNASDSSLVAVDSVTTCMDGGAPYYEFYDKPAGNYMVKAKLNGTVPGTSGYLPTYSLNTPYWYSAASVAHVSSSDTLHVNMIYGTVPTGPGFIGGLISAGAGKGTSGTYPAKGMIVYLKDAVSNFMITYTYTDTNGEYSFTNIGNGSYVVYPEEFGYHTTGSAAVVLNGQEDSAKSVSFRQYTTSKIIAPATVNAVHGVSYTNTGMSIFPNPTTGLLNLKWSNGDQGTATVLITDMTGKTVFSTNADITPNAGQAQIDLGGLKKGLYMMTVKSEHVNYRGKIEIAE